ncbi:MAG: hypothetical protein AAF316_06610 [Cyanobacteria bacterium P01_A01_bin.80]
MTITFWRGFGGRSRPPNRGFGGESPNSSIISKFLLNRTILSVTKYLHDEEQILKSE